MIIKVAYNGEALLEVINHKKNMKLETQMFAVFFFF